MQDPQARVMDIIFGRWRSQILYAGVRLGIFDALEDGGAVVSDLAGRLKLNPELTYRLLRALASLELLREDENRNFTLTEGGRLLCRNHPGTLRGIALLEEGPEHYAIWKHLPAMIRDGSQNAFMREFGRMAFEHAADDPDYGDVFNEAMSSYSAAQTGLALEALDDYDFTPVSRLCDIGGGHGHMLCSFLAKYSHLEGTVLEQPGVIGNGPLPWADRLNVGDRCSHVEGDMFTAVPEADAYMMKMILHDWNDDECLDILRNIHAAATPDARLFVVEHVIPGPDTPHFAKLFDVHMMCWGTGRERTAEEYAALMEEAGWDYRNTWYPESGMMGAVEGRKQA